MNDFLLNFLTNSGLKRLEWLKEVHTGGSVVQNKPNWMILIFLAHEVATDDSSTEYI